MMYNTFRIAFDMYVQDPIYYFSNREKNPNTLTKSRPLSYIVRNSWNIPPLIDRHLRNRNAIRNDSVFAFGGKTNMAPPGDVSIYPLTTLWASVPQVEFTPPGV